jgi:hypothetical protein
MSKYYIDKNILMNELVVKRIDNCQYEKQRIGTYIC